MSRYFFILLILFEVKCWVTILDNMVSFENSPSPKIFEFEHLSLNLDSMPKKFSIVFRVFLILNPGISYQNEELSSVFSLNNQFWMDLVYGNLTGNSSGDLEINGVSVPKINDFFFLSDGLKQEGIFISLEFVDKQLLQNGEISYRFTVRAFVKDHDVRSPVFFWREYTITTFTISSIKDIQLRFAPNKLTDSNFAVSFYQISLYPNRDFWQIFNMHFDDLGEVIYKINFYEEPAKSIFLYNQSPYVFAPAINGNISTRNGQLPSFYSDELKKTFWVGLANKTANFLEFPSNILTTIDSFAFEIRILFELYLYNYDPVTKDPVGFTVFSIEDDNENIVFEIKHFLNDFNFNPPHSFSVRVEIWVQGILETSKDLQVFSMFELRQFWMVFHKLENQNYYFKLNHFSISKGFTSIDSKEISLTKSMIQKIFLGHRQAPYGDNQLAYFFTTIVFIKNQKQFYISGVINHILKNEFQPSYKWVRTNFEIWATPVNPALSKEYEKLLSETSVYNILFQMRGCPDNCEICRNPENCLVCRSGFSLTNVNQCVSRLTQKSENHYCVWCRENIYGDALSQLYFGPSFTNLHSGKNTNDFLIFDVEFKKILNSINPQESSKCQLLADSDLSILDSHNNWESINGIHPDLSGLGKSDDNYLSQIILKNDAKYESVFFDKCEVDSVKTTFFTPDCEALKLVSSLKGASTSCFAKIHF